ncbi:MAG: class I tRNA ligase family protein [Candidatus Campbellbacteria bacterium]|nr:class I tRNA ligase family protein [Candidatus Campbellbacteria bacterium]
MMVAMAHEEYEKSDVAKKEEEILQHWQEKGIFQKTLAKESPEGEFVFYEGPPTANGRPGIHHLISRAFKDVIPRYKTMRGFHVRRKAGWDTHGLPVEIEVEKQLGFTLKKQIEEYGIAQFNEKCKESVWKYIDEWSLFTQRMGYWVDLDDAYVTYYPSYMESLWSIVAHVHKQNLLYKDYKVLPWCPRCGTALSSHELAQGYEDVKDISVYVKFKVVGEENTYLLAWTTTPWTLLGNVGLAVGEDIDYVKIFLRGEFLILSKEIFDKAVEDNKHPLFDPIGSDFKYGGKDTRMPYIEDGLSTPLKGKDLVGLSYEPLFPFLENLISGPEKEKIGNAYKVYPADFVTTTDGTGIVHTAVMYGQEDFELGNKVSLPKWHLVDETGHLVKGTGLYEGLFVRDESTAVEVIKDLLARKPSSLLFKREKFEHPYPHCWRCHTALIYYARDSWYIRMSELRDDLVKENKKINWVPEHIKEGRFGEWLREVKDWAFSRDRYWGTPLPVWNCEHCHHTEVVGSIEHLKKITKSRGNTFTFVRHGEANNNILDIASADPNAPDHLTEKGKEQVMHVSRKIKKEGVTKIYTSPFVRTRETADIIAQELGLVADAVVVDERIQELKYGDFNTKPHHDVYLYRKTNGLKYGDKLPNGESYLDVRRRFSEFLYDIDSQHEHTHVIVVTHGVAFPTISAILEGADDKRAEHLLTSPDPELACAVPVAFVPLPHNASYDIDLHKPYIDEVPVVCPKCEFEMKRTPEVMDVWFDSGSMPFAQDHYPFENEKWVDGKGYPAQYISEAIDQTRGWFYTLHAVGVLMGKGRAFENVICLGHILDAQGKKMSKSIGNVINPWEAMAKHGVDVIRFWMYSVNQPGDTKNFDEKTVDEVSKKVFMIARNVVKFYEMYKEETPISNIKYQISKHVLDVWILSRLDELLTEVTEGLNTYHTFEPTRAIKDFIQDFSTWYIRRSRDRFKSDDAEDKAHALGTTRHVLKTLATAMAPFTPFFAEEMYSSAGGELESVHLEEWPSYTKTVKNKPEKIITGMQKIRDVASRALEARMSAGIKVRQPLASLSLRGGNLTLQKFPELVALISDEVNVKEVLFKEDTGWDVELDTAVTPELKKEGDVRDLMRAIQDFRKTSGLTASDTPTLSVVTNEEGKKLIEEHKEALIKSTNLKDLTASVGDIGAELYIFSIH